MMPVTDPSSSPVLTRSRREALARRDALRRARAAVLDATRSCADDRTAVVTLQPPVTRAEVATAFDEIEEKHHLAGIHLRFDRDDGKLKAIFEPVETRDPRLSSR
jgi:hypothetical protein